MLQVLSIDKLVNHVSSLMTVLDQLLLICCSCNWFVRVLDASHPDSLVIIKKPENETLTLDSKKFHKCRGILTAIARPPLPYTANHPSQTLSCHQVLFGGEELLALLRGGFIKQDIYFLYLVSRLSYFWHETSLWCRSFRF